MIEHFKRKEIIELYQTGDFTQKEIAEEYGVSQPYVHMIAKEAGVIKGFNSYVESDDYRAVSRNVALTITADLKSKGMTLSDIAKNCKCSESYITQLRTGKRTLNFKVLVKLMELAEMEVMVRRKRVNR